MEHIQKALNRAKERQTAPALSFHHDSPRVVADAPRVAPAASGIREVRLSKDVLERERIVAHDRLDERSKSFDMLRTQVLQTMDAQQAQTLAVTSPTAGCGKTL